MKQRFASVLVPRSEPKSLAPGSKTLFQRTANRFPARSRRLLVLLLVGTASPACSTLADGKAWGEGATFRPGWKRVSRAALHAALDLQTLIPAAGAVVFSLGDLDEEVSDWAVRQNPIFQSSRTARKFSDFANIALGVEFGATVLATPGGEVVDGDWFLSKAKGFAVEGAGAVATLGLNEVVRAAVDRTRPDDSNDGSFPSGHTSAAFTFSTLANRNLQSIDMPWQLRRTAQIGNLITASAVGWARIEGEQHFPSDVLAAAALGYFTNAFIHDAFLGLSPDSRFGFVVYPDLDGGAVAGFSVRF